VRPRYETATDLGHELHIAKTWAATYDAEVRKLPEGARYWIDIGVFKQGKMVAVAEVKDRPTWMLAYGSVILSLSKVRELYSYNEMGVPAYFVARLSGVIHHVKIDDRIKDWEIRWAGRTDRNDDMDQEPCVHIPHQYFIPER
jgi:hypothetical protein